MKPREDESKNPLLTEGKEKVLDDMIFKDCIDERLDLSFYGDLINNCADKNDLDDFLTFMK